MASSSLTIPEAAKYIGYSAAYVRTLIHKGKLPSKLVPLQENSLVEHHVIDTKDLDSFLLNAPRRNRRQDGRNKYIMYATPVEYQESIRALRVAGPTTKVVAELIVPANIRKPDDV